MGVIQQELTTRAMAHQLPLTVSAPSPQVRLVEIAGELDLFTQPRLLDCVRDALRDAPPLRHLVLDLGGVTFLGASGLHAMVTAKDASELRGITLSIAGAQHRVVARPLAIVGLDRLLATYRTWTEAVDTVAG